MSLSIVIPIYNVANYLEQCLDSVVEENHFEGEVVCVNDGSTDASPDILERYAAKYNNIKVVNQKNQGLSSARNTGIEHATGDYILFLDSDDYLLPEAIKHVQKAIDAHPKVDVVCCNVLSDGIDLHFPKYMQFADGTGVEFCDYFYSKRHFAYLSEAWHYVCRREFLQQNDIQFKYGYLHEDEDFSPRILLKAQNVALMPEPIIFYRVKREGAISSNIREKNLTDTLQIVRDLNVYYQQNNATPVFYEMLFVLLIGTLQLMEQKGMQIEKSNVLLLDQLATNVQQHRTAKLALRNIGLANDYFENALPMWKRRLLNSLFKLRLYNI